MWHFANTLNNAFTQQIVLEMVHATTPSFQVAVVQ